MKNCRCSIWDKNSAQGLMNHKRDLLESGGPSFKETGNHVWEVESEPSLLLRTLGFEGKNWLQPETPVLDQVSIFKIDLTDLGVFCFGGIHIGIYGKNKIIWGWVYLCFVLDLSIS